MVNSALLKYKNFEVRLFDPSCVDNVSHWLSRDPVEKFLTSSILPYPCSVNSFNLYYNKNFNQGEHEFFSIYACDIEKHIGHFKIKNFSNTFECGTLAHIIIGNREYRGKGNGKHFVRLMAKVGFEYLSLYRLGLSVHAHNVNAVSAYIRGGFVVEGVIREVIRDEHQRYSLYQMSMLKNEWNKISQDGG